MKKLLLISFTLIIVQAFGQNQKNDSTEASTYNDYANGYSVEKPSWLNVMESGNTNAWGGTLPAVHDIKNAILITAFEKSKFKNFEDFKRIYITGNKFGQETLFSKNHIFYGRNEKDLHNVEHGVSSKLYLFFKNKIYHCQFVLLETSKSFLFINFTSTPETYEENIVKFNEFLKGLSVG
ncbi:MAG: hypothetical protein JNM71_10340 [Flavobacterium lindanitolerans]|jgi:hypothetical protein|uniref:hypothetical protein n=1 Tax=Flavobacterium lindanitolerans TaxID=428988 RepID=UPI000DB6146B|nr:hypothetical protein [Flavobacterium lindanitolerans]MBL7868408.1 hypothetical protein [Flavobacterium lindanitolerans]PZQ92545.1 MAG: hypothetical protein DI548_00680 [Flavobacterium johnsoniae]